MSKRVISALLAAAMALSVTACGNQATTQTPAETTPSAPATTPSTTPSTPAEKPKEEIELNPEALESGSKGILSLNIEDILSASEIEAMKSEPIYGKTINYFYDSGNCTSTPYLAGALGLYDSLGMKVESFKGTSIKEALGTNACQYGVSHIASMLVPITNDVDYSFVSGIHVGCKSLYVLNDSGINSTADLKGKSVAVPNGIGNSDYNITARMFDRDGMNPMTDVTLTPVETSACIAAMQNGEIAAALLSDTYAYKLVADGTLKCIRSITWDEDFQTDPCCILAMNNTFIKENPIHAKLAVYCVKVANLWAGQNPKEAVQLLIDENFISGDFDMNLELWNTLQFGKCTDEFTLKSLTQIVDDYIRLDLITASESVEDVMAKAWNPLAPEADTYTFDSKEDSASASTEKPELSGSMNVIATNESYMKLFEKFSEETGVKVELLSMSSGDVLSKLRAEGGTPSADLWFGGGLDSFISAANDDLLEPVEFSAISEIDPQFKDKDNRWFSKGLTIVGFLVNNTLLAENKMEMPTTWEALTDEQYKDEIVMSSPAISGTNYGAVNSILQTKGEEEGWKYFEAFNENVAYYTRRGSDPKNKVIADEITIGITYLDNTITPLTEDYDVTIVYPEDGIPWIPDGVAVFKNAENVEAAKYFVEWLYSNDENLCLLAEIDQKTSIKLIKPSLEGVELEYDPEILMELDLTKVGSEREAILAKFEPLMGDKVVAENAK